MPDVQELATIMAVDDTPANLRLLQEMLHKHGYRVLTFPSGQAALNVIARVRPNLILLDINMPEMDGFEVCRRLKDDPAVREIPVLFISALTDTTEKVKAFSAGAVDYVTKPFQFEEVEARVRTHLHLRALQTELEQHNLRLEDLVREKVAEISESQLATIIALASLAESRDDDTGAHIVRTREFCKMLADRLRENPHHAGSITAAYVENIYQASPLHDIGKVGIPDNILLKPGKLTPGEFAIMTTHTKIGAKTLQIARTRYPRNVFLNMGIAIAHYHHEKWDGSGYPDGLAGEDIPLAARIMAVADVYDALRSKRPYKPAFDHEKSLAIIREGAGRHFDPTVVRVFLELAGDFAGISSQLSGSQT